MTATRVDVADLIDRLGQTATECRALIRQMHEAEQSLKDTIREARAVTGGQDIRAMAEEQLRALMEEYRSTVEKAAHDAYDKIQSESEKLAEPIYETFGLAEQAAEIRAKAEARSKGIKPCHCKGGKPTVIAHEDSSPPRAGDIDICAHCAGVRTFTGGPDRHRASTPGELLQYSKDLSVVRTVAMLREQLDAKQAGRR